MPVELTGQNEVPIMIVNEKGERINEIPPINPYNLEGVGMGYVPILDNRYTRARIIKQYSVDGEIIKEFDGKDTYFNKEEKTGIKMTDRKGPEESWTYENDWEKKGIWIIKKTRVGSDPYN